MYKLLNCILLATLTTAVCFISGYLIVWLHEVATGRRADIDVIIAYTILVIMLSLGFYYWS